MVAQFSPRSLWLPIYFVWISFLLLIRIPTTNGLASPQRPRSRPTTSLSPSTTTSIPPPSHALKIGSSLVRNQGVLLVDVENVRGKSGFTLSHNDLKQSLEQWITVCQLSVGQVILMVDHGNSGTAVSSTSLAIVLAGPSQKADDVIANDIGKICQWTQEWKQQKQIEKATSTLDDKPAPVMVVTDDQGLLSRCRKTTARKQLQIVSPLSLLEELESIHKHRATFQSSPMVQQAAREIQLGAEWMLAYSKVQAAKTKHIPNKRRKVLQKNLNQCQEQLLTQAGDKGIAIHHYAKTLQLQQQQGMAKNDDVDMPGYTKGETTPIAIEAATSQISVYPTSTASTNTNKIHTTTSNRTTPQQPTLHPDIQAAVLEEWEQLRDNIQNRPYNNKEKTEDRVVLAEKFRKELEEQYGNATQELYHRMQEVVALMNHNDDNNTTTTTATTTGLSCWSPGQRYIHHWIWSNHIHSRTSGNDNDLRDDCHYSTLRLVVISDTHGFEQDLGPLPTGDVLLHLGDFALEGSPSVKESSLATFDQWLAQQPHPHKVVLKGNHDPRVFAPFEGSGALYVTAPRTLHMAGFAIALVPFLSKMTTRCLPSQCDVVASHVPPKGVLDTCSSGKSAGCQALRRRLKQLQHQQHQKNPVQLVLCGHIHESRGWVRHDFADPAATEGTTLVVNAASANDGRATKLVRGPVVVELTRQGDTGDVHVDFEMAKDIDSSEAISSPLLGNLDRQKESLVIKSQA